MADKAISELVAAPSVTPTDLFVLEQNGTAKKLTGQILENWLVSFADGHGGIQSIAKLGTSGLADTYRITLADTTTFDFVVTNGRGISSLRKTATSGLVDTYTFTYNDGTTGTFTVTNGEKGDKGDNAYIWVKYASQEPTASSNSFGDLPDDWMGVYFGTASTAPSDWQQYRWYRIKGDKGETGDPATLTSAEVTYQAGDSGTIIPSGNWSSSVPTVTPGRYLWTRQVLRFNTGDPITSYSVSRFGIDGTGAVSSVAGVAPDESGNVPLDAASVKALPIGGGTMEGSINMNGQKLTGLNAPTEYDEPATKGYVDDLEPDLTGYATETYVNDAVKKAVPRNMLDNSYFRNTIKQRGVTEHAGTTSMAYCSIDRWLFYGSGTAFTISNTGLSASNDGTDTCGIAQRLFSSNFNVGQTYTIACKGRVTGRCYLSYGNNKSAISESSNVLDTEDEIHIFTFVTTESTDGMYNFRIRTTENAATIELEWMALYEGEYTLETLPEYQPKDYFAELLKCQRYYRKLTANAIVPYPGHITGTTRIVLGVGFAPFRVAPTAVMSDDFKITVRLGTGGYSPIANNSGGHPQSIVGTYVNSGYTAVYFEFGESPGTNNMPVTSNIAEGYLELSADL